MNNGLYNGASQILPYSITYAAAPTYAKHTIMNLSTNNAGDFILVDSDGNTTLPRYVSVGNDINVGGAISGTSIKTDGTALRTKIIAIGVWDMVATAAVSIAHGLTLADIRSVSAIVYKDGNASVYPIDYATNAAVSGFFYTDSTNVILNRQATSIFNTTDFDAAAVSRGWITITYEA